MRARLIPIGIAAAAGGWLGLLLAAPVATPPLSAIVYLAASLVCHQRPDRSLHLGAAQLPVCARCLGIYAGAAFSTVVLAAGSVTGAGWARGIRQWAAGEMPRRVGIRALLAAAAAPTLAGVVMERAGLWTSGNAARAVAGALLGTAVGCVVSGPWAAPDSRWRWRGRTGDGGAPGTEGATAGKTGQS